MKVLDARNCNVMPQVIEISQFIITAKYIDHWASEDLIQCLLLDGMLVPCVLSKRKDYDGVLCGAYKTQRGFNKWLNQFYPHAYKQPYCYPLSSN